MTVTIQVREVYINLLVNLQFQTSLVYAMYLCLYLYLNIYVLIQN